MTDRFSTIGPTEKTVLHFEFAAGLSGGETLQTPTVACTVDYGTHANPESILGSATVSGTQVLVPVSSLVNDVDYHITVTCTTSNTTKTLSVAGILPVRTP